MKKKSVIIIIVCVVLAAVIAGGLFVYRHRGGDVIGVTSYPDKNTVIMNVKQDNTFVSGTGTVAVGQGQRLHLDYSLSSGSMDVYFNNDEDALSAYQNMDLDRLPQPEEMTGEGSFGQSDVEGKGSADFDAEPGVYTVFFVIHDAEGRATVTAKAN